MRDDFTSCKTLRKPEPIDFEVKLKLSWTAWRSDLLRSKLQTMTDFLHVKMQLAMCGGGLYYKAKIKIVSVG